MSLIIFINGDWVFDINETVLSQRVSKELVCKFLSSNDLEIFGVLYYLKVKSD